uniref:Ribosomal protein L2 n=1 Tax=Goniomonas avonlea TaxID=1255295 RepID=A0A348G6L7_9CRYP|nr:ribosomal protein L2 [Goniomonas avonlea]
MKKLTCGLIHSGGRNHSGKIVSFCRGGGRKQLTRSVLYHREMHPILGCGASFISGVVESFEDDSHGFRKLALVKWDLSNLLSLKKVSTIQHWSYILATVNMRCGQRVFFRKNLALLRSNTMSSLIRERFYFGNAYPLSVLTIGSSICNIGGRFARSGGTFGRLLEKHSNGSTLIKLPSGKNKIVSGKMVATLGIIDCKSKVTHKYILAGDMRNNGWRPKVRGVAMNPFDHPHGGGEGKSSGGRPSVTPWAKPAHGVSTRKLVRGTFF